MGKPLARLIKKKRERAQINKIRNEKGEVTINTTEIQRIIRDYYEQLYTIKWTTQKKWTHSSIVHIVQSPKTESGRNKIYELTNYQ